MILNQLPNILTIMRILLVPPLIYYLYQHEYKLAFALLLIAGASDGVDGYMAKRFNWGSRFGAIADPLADKLLMVGTYLALTVLEHLPWWLFIAVVARDIIIVTGGLVYHYVIGPFEMSPSLVSKSNTLFQILLVLTVFFNLAYPVVPSLLIFALMALVMVLTCVSGCDYVWTWGKQFIKEKRRAQ